MDKMINIPPGDFLLGRAAITYICRGKRGDDGRDMETPLARPSLRRSSAGGNGSCIPAPGHLRWAPSRYGSPDHTQTTNLVLNATNYYIYIYAFSRRFYPKRLTGIHSGMCVPWALNPWPFALLTQCSTTEIRCIEYNEEWNVFSAFNPSKWSIAALALGFGALLKRLTSVVDTSCQSRDSNPQPWVTSGFKSNTLSIRPRQFLHWATGTLLNGYNCIQLLHILTVK